MAPPVVIDVSLSDECSSSGENDSARPAPPQPQLPFTHSLELLAPLFPELARLSGGGDARFPATIARTAADWLRLVFPHAAGGNGARAAAPLEKELECAGLASDGCRNCRFAQLLRGLLVLVEQRVLRVDATYVVGASNGGGGERVATLQLDVQLHEDASTASNLQDFDFVISHLQPVILSVAGYMRSSTPTSREQQQQQIREDALKKARESTCHVVGCNLHQRDGMLPGVDSKTLFLSDVFRTLTSPTALDRMEIRDDRTYAERMKRPKREVVVTDLPIVALQTLVCMMDARDLASLSGVCSLFQHLAYEVVPGLNLMLYRHQQKALKFLLYREAPPSAHKAALPHPFLFPPVHSTEASLVIDVVDHKIVKQEVPAVQDCRGGLFCDEPGLGKTVTMLALLLRTKGQRTKPPTAVAVNPDQQGSVGRLRSSGARGRTLRRHELTESIASLIIVPAPLVEHWKFQIETHIEQGALKVFVDIGKTLPSSDELATYDVVITSLERLGREWKYNRPMSALEERAPERYGFEDQPRFVDGSIRGEMSPLLRVHWVRIVVDEGHKLGGTSENSQMRMARIFSAEKRWVMTGTPTPNTMQSADLRHMHGLLVFLKDAPYGDPDGKAWLKAVAKPFEKNEPIAFLRLQHLLSRIMMRHTKVSIRDILPDPIRRTVFIDPTPKEHEMYNAVTAGVRANLVSTNYDPKTPGRLHPDSLLNPVNRKYAMQVVKNLRTATCGGMSMTALLAQKDLLDTINLAQQNGMHPEMQTVMIEYLNRARENRECTPCMKCKRQFRLLMVIPCGHLCCADCIEDRMNAVGARCWICNVAYDIEVFQELQPGFEFVSSGSGRMEDLNAPGGTSRVRNLQREAERSETVRAWRERERTSETRAPQPFIAINFLRDFDIIDASKALYAVARVKELKEEYARNYVEASTASRAANASRHVKAIVFSQFSSHIWELKVAFAQQGIPTADFITGVSAVHRKKNLRAFRQDPKMNVLLLTEVGSHGLDLSFVTHMFLMEEIWDKSLEKQVVSRAHRMGARQAVVVEQIVMRDTIEGVLLRMNEQILQRQERRLKAAEAEEQSLISRNEEQGYHHHSRKSTNLEGKFQPRKKQKKRHKAKAETTSTSTGASDESNENKATRLQRQLYYVLQNVRLLGDEIAAEPGHVRFFVEDEQGNVLRRGSHRMAAYKTSTGELVTVPPEELTRRSAPDDAAAAVEVRAAIAHSGGSRPSSTTPVVKAEPRASATAALPTTSALDPAHGATSASNSSATVRTPDISVDMDASVGDRKRKKARTSNSTSDRAVRFADAPSSPASRTVAEQPQSRVKGEVTQHNRDSTVPSSTTGIADTEVNAASALSGGSTTSVTPVVKGEPLASLSTPDPAFSGASVSNNPVAIRTSANSGNTRVKSERALEQPGTQQTLTPLHMVTEEEASARTEASPRIRSPKRESARSDAPPPVQATRLGISVASVKHDESDAAPSSTQASPRLGTLADPIVLTDDDEEMPEAPAAVPPPPVNLPPASGGTIMQQKGPLRRVKFATVDTESTETESDFIPSDGMDDDD